MCSKWNGVAGVRGNRTMNFLVLVIGTGLWVSCEPFKHHVLNILRPYILQDVWRFEIPPNRHVILALYTVIHVFFDFFCDSYQKSRNLLP